MNKLKQALQERWSHLQRLPQGREELPHEWFKYVVEHEPEALHVMVLPQFSRSASVALIVAQYDARLLEQYEDYSIACTTTEATELIAHGYGHKLHMRHLTSQFILEHQRDLRMDEYCDSGLYPYTHARDIETVCIPKGLFPTYFSVRDMAYYIDEDLSDRLPPESRAQYQTLRNVRSAMFGTGPDDYDHFYAARDSKPEEFTMFLVAIWYCEEGEMDRTHQAIDWLVGLGELRHLASCFIELEYCDPYLALIERAPGAIKYLDDRSIVCRSNTVRDLLVLHGQGRKLSPTVLSPEFVVRHWDDVGPLPHEWGNPRWAYILSRADELPPTPLPMIALLEIGGNGYSIEDWQNKLDRHFTAVEANASHSGSRGEYRALYHRLLARW